jgi:hypothetical protein
MRCAEAKERSSARQEACAPLLTKAYHGARPVTSSIRGSSLIALASGAADPQAFYTLPAGLALDRR